MLVICKPIYTMSLPTWERGLKHGVIRVDLAGGFVAPHVGAWIETGAYGEHWAGFGVAPHVGAWIETGVKGSPVDVVMSLPTWERGLKPKFVARIKKTLQSLPTWERGLKRLSPCL